VLWGRFAQQKEMLIDTKKHTILKAAHPSPFSAYNGFLGCKHFSKINALLNPPIHF
jgi:uracil-DNA glycosylase